MLNDPMDPPVRRTPVLPESLRDAVRGAEATGRAAEERAHLAMPFRARLRARDAVRPQPTLSILTGSKPVTSAPSVMRLPPPVQMPVAPPSEVRALKRQPPARPPAKPKREDKVVPAAVTGAAVTLPKAGANGSGARRAADEEEEGGWKLSEFSQFAFAGLAVLGLAGLSVMAADNALNGGKDKTEGEGDTLAAASLPDTDVSVAALGDAAAPAGAAPTPWFDYKGTADILKARVAELQAQEQEAARLAQTEADREAALAIANAEAARAAAEQPAASAGPTVIDARLRDRLATEEAMRQADANAAAQLLAEQNAAAAKAEADRIAAEEAARAAAAQAEAKRLADLEAQRLADLEAKRLADLEARRLAAEAEAKRLADLKAKESADAAEAKRLADLEAKRAADAEANRLADLAAKEKADAEAARLAVVSAAAIAPAEPKRLSVPPAGAPSLKPKRPATEQALADASGPKLIAALPAERAAPPSLSAPSPEVRPLALPRPVGDFIAERAEYTAGRALDQAGLDALKADFLALVEASADGTHHELTTPDGRPLLIHFERTVPVDPLKASISTIGYAPSADGAVTRAYLQPVSVNVYVMCRDVAYAFPGQERGRFAACQGDDGTWRMARATNVAANPI
ncbi:cell envelope integrity protein TolA [Hyphomonas sp.]|uniref:cell envelope integrity protein TolA n=1 Tax=Hyphomonas sp. TaxID=87 RepID=UPI00391E0272